MVVFTSLGLRPRREIDEIKNELVLSDDEIIVFDMAIRDKSAQEIAFTIHKSPRTVFRIMERLRKKIINYYDTIKA